MGASIASAGARIEMSARVFRRMAKPRWLPKAVWLALPKVSLFGRWEEQGVVASTDKGNLTVGRV